MKKILFVFLFFIAYSINGKAQEVIVGIKGGGNFSDLDGANLDSNVLIRYHFGAVVEVNLLPIFALQTEALFSSQGAKVTNQKDFNLDYVSVPVLAKFYIIPNNLSLDIGSQFSFLLKDDIPSSFKTEPFELAGIGGVGLKLPSDLFLQARYVVGLNDMTQSTALKNKVIQISIGYNF
jgi:hypothetical protein